MHPENCFITLTYSDENLGDARLRYSDFQKFMKKLRKLQNDPVGVFVTGEYGEQTKRPHWHAIIFNWSPKDGVLKYSNGRGDKVYSSETLSKTWGLGIAEYGSVTLESAGYCARYAAKKLVHGHDGKHDFDPISKKSNKNAIGRKWIEKFYPDVFSYGVLVLPDGNTCSIPRYYEKWLKENQPDAWYRYITEVKPLIQGGASHKVAKMMSEFWDNLRSRDPHKPNPFTPLQKKHIITKQKFEQLQAYLKL